ncbi:MAG: trehalose-phosphatase [Microcella sp.]
MSAELDPALLDALARFARLPRVLIALDFDGTLAPEVDVPDEARALPEAHEALLALAALPNTAVALVSGRSLESLAHVGQLPDAVPLIGSHGLEVRLAPDDVRPAATADDRARVDRLRAVVAPLVEMVEGAWIEEKPAGFAVHTRTVEQAAARALIDTVRTAAWQTDERMTVRDGKNLIEFSARDATKGDGLELLRRELRPDAVLFAGDDVTDEDALAVLDPGDVGIKVGSADTVAPYRVHDPAGMVAVLELLVAKRGSVAE